MEDNPYGWGWDLEVCDNCGQRHMPVRSEKGKAYDRRKKSVTVITWHCLNPHNVFHGARFGRGD